MNPLFSNTLPREYIPITWLSMLDYCEYQVLFASRGVKKETSKEMQEGLRKHEELFEKRGGRTGPVNINDIIARKAPLVVRETNLKSEEKKIRGRVDELCFNLEDILVIDDKPGIKPYDSYKNQVRAYSLCLVETYAPKMPVFSVLRNRDDKRVFWVEEYDKAAESKIELVINHAWSLLNGREQYTPTSNQNKCRKCGYRRVCDKKVE